MAPVSCRIRKADRDDLQHILERAASYGWNSGIDDGSLLYLADPDGFFAGEVDGELVAAIAGPAYPPAYGFIGLWFVLPSHRGRNIGAALLHAALNRLGERGVTLNAVPETHAFWKRCGFVDVYSNVRFSIEGARRRTTDPAVIPVRGDAVEKVIAYDGMISGIERYDFVKAWVTQPRAKAVCYKDGATVRGYGVMRKARSGFRLGPVFADGSAIAAELLASLLSQAPESEPVLLEVPSANSAATELAESFGMKRVYESYNMTRGSAPDAMLDRWFGVTNLNVG
jgi:GNAT superfamily N-acetyltransferase